MRKKIAMMGAGMLLFQSLFEDNIKQQTSTLISDEGKEKAISDVLGLIKQGE